jgi:predicted nucleic acid-binding protein
VPVALLDTTVLIDLGRRPHAREHHHARVAVRGLLQAGEMLFTSRINEAEFRIGPEMSADRPREQERVARVLAGIVILEFNAEAALRYAVIKAATLKRGRPIGDCDAMIAAVALAHGQLLLTRNPRHFRNIAGLIVQTY